MSFRSARRRISTVIAGTVLLLSTTFLLSSPSAADQRQHNGRRCERFSIEASLTKEGPSWEVPYYGKAEFTYGRGLRTRTETASVTIYPGSPTPLQQKDGTQLAAQTNYYAFEDGSTLVGQNTAVVTTESTTTASIDATVRLAGGTSRFDQAWGKIHVEGQITFSQDYPWGELAIDATGRHCVAA